MTDRRNESAIALCRKITRERGAYLSTITVAEILTGAYLRSETAVQKARRVLGQFQWIDVDGTIAEKTAQLTGYLLTAGKIIEFQDIIIAATTLVLEATLFITQNPDHFKRIPLLANIVKTLDEASNFSSP